MDWHYPWGFWDGGSGSFCGTCVFLICRMGSGPLSCRGTRKAVGELVSSSCVPWSRASTQGAWSCPVERGQSHILATRSLEGVGEPIGESVRTWTWYYVKAPVFRHAGPCLGSADLVARQMSFPVPIFSRSIFIEIQFTYRVVYSFKVYILVVFSIVAGLWKCHHYLTPDNSITPVRISSHPHLPPPALGNQKSTSCLCGCVYSEHLT